jgi:hypothetical protein
MKRSHTHFYISEVNVEKMKLYLQATSVFLKNYGIYSAPPALAAPCVPTIRIAVETPSTL